MWSIAVSPLDPPKSSQINCVDDAKFLIELHIDRDATKRLLLDILATVEQPGTDAERWDRINRAQQAIATRLPEAAAAEHFRAWLRQAQALNIAGLADFERMASRGLRDTAGAPLDTRDVLLSLVQATQAAYRERRMTRELRNATARSLATRGVSLAFVAMVFTVLAATSPTWSGKPDLLTETSMAFSSMTFTIGLVLSFGLLGAFFSRLISFQSRVKRFSLTDYLVTFQLSVMWVRLVVGAIGALVFYLVLRAGLLGGSALPDFARLKEPYPTGQTLYLTGAETHAELAKLMVWSFIAGFSERLVPDTLTSIEARADKTQDEPKPPATPSTTPPTPPPAASSQAGG